ncbi:hypothetical protein V6206_16735 [Enterobacter hormaechei]|uniref:hypothetical protein n=1 Tax=Enterobacteriaceae TaxID=543 RepID=UPI00128BED93|nr:hypothetical protein [Escherichia coli]EGI5543939.1 hypothetical protein [Salmonella enterica subsp. enterica serovar Augustenborg]MPU94436.1 hypothetical protein [Escherichia coli]
MTFLLRKFSYPKWEKNKGLSSDDFSADSITGCTRTTANKLSVWRSDTTDFKSDYVEKLIVALATTMPSPATIDLVWLREEWFAEKGILLEDNPGDTKYESVNNLHKDIASLNHKLLAMVGSHMLEQLEGADNYLRVNKRDLINLVVKWMRAEGEFTIDDLEEKWQEQLKKL